MSARVVRAVSAGLGLLVLAEAACFHRHVAIGRALADAARRFDRRGPATRPRVLVLGDSSAVGTGADSPADSVAGRLAAAHPGLDVWNLAENGLRTAGLLPILQPLAGSRFDAILIHIGVNDIVRFTPIPVVRAAIGEALALARTLSSHVFLLTGGNIGLAPALPPGAGWLITRRAREVRALFIDAARAAGAVYVDMFDGVADRPFTAAPHRFFARDGFHPNSEGYALWYEAIVAAMREAGVVLEHRK
jgi:lysophospholipase L1-like esterase